MKPLVIVCSFLVAACAPKETEPARKQSGSTSVPSLEAPAAPPEEGAAGDGKGKGFDGESVALLKAAFMEAVRNGDIEILGGTITLEEDNEFKTTLHDSPEAPESKSPGYGERVSLWKDE